MLDAWDEYDYRKDSDNDRPGIQGHPLRSASEKCHFPLPPSLPPPSSLFVSDVFGPKQQYIAFLLENSGMQVGSYVVCSHNIICTLVE